MIYIEKYTIEGIEYLPDITETRLWPAHNPDTAGLYTATERRLALLYASVAERENYFQIYSPTAFGNPDYERRCGFVDGILTALGVNEKKERDRLVYLKGNKTLLVIDKIKRPESYYQELADIKAVRKDLGF